MTHFGRNCQANSGWSSNYKLLAKDVPVSECPISNKPISKLAVDCRSRIFRYIIDVYAKRPIKEKIICVYNLLSHNIQEEKLHVFEKALIYIHDEIKHLELSSCVYIFGSKTLCPFKRKIREFREIRRKDTWNRLQQCLKQCSKDIFNLDIILECSKAFESYLICCLDTLELLYNKSSFAKTLNIIVPDYHDDFESDKLAAKFDNVLSYDFDCIALFGAQMMIKEVYPKVIKYVTLPDIMNTFRVTTKEDLIYRCCLIGTDYNLGWKGIGPKYVVKIDKKRLKQMVQSCLTLQSINLDELFAFFAT